MMKEIWINFLVMLGIAAVLVSMGAVMVLIFSWTTLIDYLFVNETLRVIGKGIPVVAVFAWLVYDIRKGMGI